MGTAEGVAHGRHQRQDIVVTDPVKNLIGIFARREDILVTQDRQMLGDVALGRADEFDQILYAGFLDACEDTQNLQSQRMSHGFQ